MAKCVGGSWDGSNREGYPFKRRKLVLAKEHSPEQHETYIREEPGGSWIFAHDGATSEADGPWDFED